MADHAAASYAISEMRYLEKWSGPFMARLLAKLRVTPTPSASLRAGSVEVPGEDVLTEASPSPVFSTAAGHFGPATLPEEIRKTLKTPFYLRTVARSTGEVLSTVKICP